MSRIWLLAFVSAVLLTDLATPARAQVAGGTILGAVTDSSGGSVANANVLITDEATGVERKVTTNSAGLYSAPNLLPGTYDVRVSAAGFSDAISKGVALTVGAQQPVNLVLAVGATTQHVDVESSAPAIDKLTSGLSNEVDGLTIRELPLNGRDWPQLATLEPGVNQVRNQSAIGGVSSGDVVRALRGFGNQLSVSGARPTQNNYRLDGISFNDYTNGAPGGVLGTLSGVDAIQEFSVLTTNYSAEYGRTSGGVINAITRSGANAVHGDVYEFIRNSDLDARNFFDGASVPPFKRNQFGGSIGGPIKKDKTFFFFNYEGLRQSLTSTQVNTVLSAAARNGVLSSGNVTVDPRVAPFLAFWPLPNSGLLPGGDTGLYSVATLQRGNQNFYTARIDHRFSDSDNLTGTFVYDDTRLIQPDSLNNEYFLNSNSRPFGSLEETHIFTPSLVNSLRFGFSRNSAVSTTSSAINPLADNLSLGAVPGRPAPFIIVPGIATFYGGLGGFPNFSFGWNSFQGYDDAFWTHGSHSLKFGFAAERMQSNNLLHFTDNGRFVFGSLSDFLTDNPLVFASTLPGTATPRGIRETLYAGYVQDDWRLRPNLTINLGVRYEMVTVPTEVENKLATLRSMTADQVHLGNPYFDNPTKKNFEPRVGFAWDPSGHGKTSIRSGFGIFDVLPLPYEFVIISSASAPFAQNTSSSNLPQGSFPTQALYIAGATPSSSLAGQRVAYVDPHPGRSYVAQWNFNIQQQLSQRTTASIAYVGSRGVRLPYRTDDADIVMPTATPAGYVWPTPVGSGTPINPNVGRIDRLDFGADSYYHALQTGLRVNAAHGLQLQASYTWGKSIDTGSSTIAGDQFANSPSSVPLWFDPKTRRGVSDFNLGQNFVVSGVWTVPSSRSLSGVAGWASRGWELGGEFQASTGAPFSVYIGGDPLGMNNTDPWDYPDRLTGGGCGSLVNPGNPNNYVKTQCFAPANPLNRLGNEGRNILTGPGLLNLDTSLFKNNPIRSISEAFNIQFRAEFFNILNHANFAPPLDNLTLFNQDGSRVASGGVIDATQTSSRQIQFGIKVIW